ncbi:hypothetical protein SSCG_02589 [Streptomyces clavuligerus]|nr:hypothetical protein SSCG_02589 [Streptomyces clavuligerus]
MITRSRSARPRPRAPLYPRTAAHRPLPPVDDDGPAPAAADPAPSLVDSPSPPPSFGSAHRTTTPMTRPTH